MQRTKRGKCPFCLPEGGAIFDAEYGVPEVVVETSHGPEREPEGDVGDDKLKPVWTCRNCGMEIKRRTPGRKSGWTRSQKKAFEFMRAFWRSEREHVDPTGFTVTSKTHCTEFHAVRSATGRAIVTIEWTEFLVNRHGKHLLRRCGVFGVGRYGDIQGTKYEDGKTKKYRGSSALIHATY